MSKFYSISQWNGLPRESVASLISDHILHLPKHRAECCIIETKKVLVTWTTKMTFDTVISAFDRLERTAILLKQARDLLSSGNNPQKALELALSVMKMFEKFGYGKQSLELLRCLHVTAEKYCSLGQYYEASPLFEHSIEIPANQILLDALTLQGMGFITLNNTLLENWEESQNLYNLKDKVVFNGGSNVMIQNSTRGNTLGITDLVEANGLVAADPNIQGIRRTYRER